MRLDLPGSYLVDKPGLGNVTLETAIFSSL
jgi:hypothetical protein